MKNLNLLIILFLIIYSGSAQDTFTYRTVKASNVEETVVQLDGVPQGMRGAENGFTNMAGMGGGTVTGGTIGNLSVSATGGANYTVPIAVPPGLNGVQPEIALTFDSQSGNGLAGWGWNVSGVSVITRIPSTQFHDDRIDPVDFDLLDRFALDGQRLIVKTGNYGTDGAVYQTEKYSNIKIISYGTHPTSGIEGPKYFKVFYPDGSIAFYGYNNDSRSRTDYAISYWENPQGIRITYNYTTADNTLSIDKISYGSRGTSTPLNTVEFDYGTRARPEQAYIGGISFRRKNLLKKIRVNGNGTPYRNYELINNYSSSLFYNRLTGIQEKTGDNSLARNAISFNYGDTSGGIAEVQNDFDNLSVGNIEQRNAEVVSLDISGDGKMDFIVYPIYGPDYKRKFWLFSDFQVGGLNWGTEVNTGLFTDIFPISWLNYDNKLLANQGLVVVQNEGTEEVKFTVLSSGGAAQPVAYKYEKIWEAPTYKPQDYQLYGNATINRVPMKYISGDFNGDGLSDVMALEQKYTATSCTEVPSNYDPTCTYKITRDGMEYCCFGCSTYTVTSSAVHLIQLDRRKTSNFAGQVGSLGHELKATDKLLTMDVNGDGRTDILQFQEGKVYVYSLNDNNYLQLLWETQDTRIDLDYRPMPGDYNGDGKTDFMVATANNSQTFATFLSTGIGFIKSEKLQPFEYKARYDNGQGTFYGYDLIPLDVNGDGRTDIIDYKTVTYNGNTNGTQYVYLYQNTAPGSTDPNPAFAYAGYKAKTGNLQHFPIPVFLTSDRPNRNLDFASISDDHVTSFEFSKDHRKDITLEQVTNNGLITDIKYDQVNPYYQGDGDPNYSHVYTAGYGQIFPYVNVNVAPSFKVVRELEQSGSGIERTQKFLYGGAVSHTGGLGFIGFETLMRSNWYGNGVTQLWTVSKHDPLIRGAVKEQWVSESPSSTPYQYLSKTDYYYDDKLISNQGSPSAPQFQDSIRRSSSIPGQLTDRASQIIFLLPGFHGQGSNGTYLGEIVPPEEQPGADGYAGVFDLRVNKVENDNVLTGVFTTETYTYDAYGNRLTAHTVFPGGSKTTTVQYSNNLGATDNTYHIGRPTKKVESSTLNGNTLATEEQYTYANNLVSVTKTRGNGTPWLTVSFQYDANGNVLQKTLAADGEASRTEIFQYTGYGERFLTRSTDIEGLATNFTYDAVTGDLKTTTDPFGRVTGMNYDKWGRLIKETDYLGKETDHGHVPLIGGGLKKTTDYATGAKEETEYNAFGWVIKTGTLSLDNQWSYKSFEYDVSGRKIKESEPYIGGAGQWNIFGFDANGRLVSQQLYTGKTINITYPGLSIIVDDGTKSVTTTLDALGNKVAVQDPGGTVHYTYFANGTLKTADYEGHTVTVGIDGWGRRSSLNDPSAGTYTYSYNGFGELLEETTPKGTTTYEYDDYGKLTTQEMSGDLTDYLLTYQYDGTTKLLTQIAGQDNTNNRAYTYQYTYDSYKRPATIKENTGLAEFEKQYTYDTYGRVYKEKQISKNLTNALSSTVTTRNVYDGSGILMEIWNDGTTDKLWELDQINARGQALTINLGNGMVSTKTYDSYGYITKTEDKESGTNPTVALHTEYSFNAQQGTLDSRENFGLNWQESFGYDNLDRLTTISGDATKTMAYDVRGRITSNTDIGSYAYDNGNKYRLQEIAPNTPGETYFQAHPTQTITYNAFKKPIDIHEEGHGRVSFEYGPLMNRSHAYYGGEDEDRLQRRYRKHYSAIIPSEIVEDTQTGSTKIITFVGGDAYTAPVAYIKKTGTGAIDEYHYLHRDYLGSILAITDADGDVIEERQFGAWGSVDKFLGNNANTVFNHESLLGRGYTGHEHFFEVSLIHMNGRMYDPIQGRFLSPDNYIQDPFNTQNYNRYGYVLNNPLMYTDVSGEWAVETIVVAVLAALIIVGGSAVLVKRYNDSLKEHGSNQAPPSVPTNNENSSNIASSISRPSQGTPEWRFDLPSWQNVKDFGRGLGDGFVGGGRSTLKFVESLGTAKGWEDLGHGFVDLAQMGLVVSSANGIMLRSQMTNSIVWAVEDLPNKTAYQWGYGVGYGAEKVV